LAEYADRIALLADGQLVALGTPREIYGDVARLSEHALRPPQVAATFYSIGTRGLPVPQVPVRLEEGKAALRLLAADCRPAVPQDLPAPTPHGGAALLAAEGLGHTYPDGTQALRGVDIAIREGEYVLLVGQNGAGKSTLVKHFLRLLEPTQGRVAVGGADTRAMQMSDLAKRIGYVAQNPDNQIFNKSVSEEVAFALKNLGHTKEEVAARTEECLRSMGLWEQRERHPLALPRGDRARVVIAAILAMRPEIIIFDEPTTGQDYRGASYILDLSRELHRQGKTVVVITHHLYLMPDYAERVIVMGKGTVLLDAPIRTAYHEVDLLQSTFLTPPQAVLLARELAGLTDESFPLLTPAELAGCFAPGAARPTAEWAREPGGIR
jgi:energy-coupling factor transport system ATP-binding protein